MKWRSHRSEAISNVEMWKWEGCGNVEIGGMWKCGNVRNVRNVEMWKCGNVEMGVGKFGNAL